MTLSSSCAGRARSGRTTLAALLLWAVASVMPSAGRERPYVLLGPVDVAAAKSAATTSHAEIWSALLAHTEDHVPRAPWISDDSPPGEIWDHGNDTAVFAFARMISGDPRHGDLTRRWLEAAVELENWGISDDPDLAISHMLIGISLAYDWAYDTLDPTLRARVAAKIEREAGILYRALDQWTWLRRATGHNHNWIAYCALGLAGMTLIDEAPDAADWFVAASNNFEIAMSEMAGVTDGSYNDSAFHYWEFGTSRLTLFLHALRLHTGRDLFDNPWLKATADWQLQVALPDPVTHALPIGDTDLFEGHPELALLRQLAGEYNDGNAEWLAQQWLPFCVGDEARASRSAFEFIFYNPEVQPVPPSNLPTSVLFDDWGVAVMRTGWGRKDTVLSFKSGAPGGRFRFEATKSTNDFLRLSPGHNHPDQNSFFLCSEGEVLAADPGYQMPKWTADHNCVVIDGQGQVGEGSRMFDWAHPEFYESDGEISAFASTPGFDYVAGEAARPFADELNITRNTRQLLFVKPGYVVMVDSISSPDPHDYEYLLHIEGEGYRLAGDRWLIGKADRMSLATYIAAPDACDVTIEQTGGVTNWLFPQGTPGNWHAARISPATSVNNTRFVTVHIPFRDPPTAPEITCTESENACLVTYASDQGIDRTAFALQEGDWSIDALQSDAACVAVRTGKTLAAFMSDGTQLSFAGEPVLQSGRQCVVQATYRAPRLELDYTARSQTGDNTLTVRAPGCEEVILNGNPAAFTAANGYVAVTVD